MLIQTPPGYTMQVGKQQREFVKTIAEELIKETQKNHGLPQKRVEKMFDSICSFMDSYLALTFSKRVELLTERIFWYCTNIRLINLDTLEALGEGPANEARLTKLQICSVLGWGMGNQILARNLYG